MQTIIDNPIEHQGKRILDFNRMDTLHQWKHGETMRRFNAKKDRLIEGIDYFILDSVLITQEGYIKLTRDLTDDANFDVKKSMFKNYF